MFIILRLLVLVLAPAMIVPGAADAYVGPGAGLGLIGSLLAVLGAILIAITGLIVLPVRMLFKRRKVKAPVAQASESSST
jgi:hypothetical protein